MTRSCVNINERKTTLREKRQQQMHNLFLNNRKSLVQSASWMDLCGYGGCCRPQLCVCAWDQWPVVTWPSSLTQKWNRVAPPPPDTCLNNLSLPACRAAAEVCRSGGFSSSSWLQAPPPSAPSTTPTPTCLEPLACNLLPPGARRHLISQHT